MTVNLVIDGREIQVLEEQTVLEAAQIIQKIPILLLPLHSLAWRAFAHQVSPTGLH